MAPHLGEERALALSLYKRELEVPSQETVEVLKSQYGGNKRRQLSRFMDKELYRAYSRLQDLMNTSQGAEPQMSSYVRNHIQCVKPQKQLKAVISTQRTAFLKRKTAPLANRNSVPPRIENHIDQVILEEYPYHQSVRFIEGTNFMEATVVS